jgi:hypothetical protein
VSGWPQVLPCHISGVIEKQEFQGQLVRKRSSQLLEDPTARRMPSDVEVQNLPPVVANNKRNTVTAT